MNQAIEEKTSTSQPEQLPTYLTKSMRDSVQQFFNNFELCSICVADFEKGHLYRDNKDDTVADFAKFLIKVKGNKEAVPVELTFVQKEKPSDTSFTKDKDDWKMNDEANDIRFWKFPGEEWFMDFKTKISPSEFDVPGFRKFLEDRFAPPIKPGEAEYDEDILEALSSISSYLTIIDIIQKQVNDFVSKVDRDKFDGIKAKIKALDTRIKNRERAQPLVDELKDTDSEPQKANSAII